MNDNPLGYQFISMTVSLCSTCLERLPAKIIKIDNKIYIKKNCPVCGVQTELLEENADYYQRRLEYDKPGTASIVETSVNQECPFDCGLCPDHEQHTCIGLVEITDRCNLNCPVCYANSGVGGDLDISTIEQMIKHYQIAENGKAEILQISGGEPTLHPQLLEIIRLAKANAIRYVMVNTNGLLIGENKDLAKQFSEFKKGFEVYLQFDGFDKTASGKLRGRDVLDLKLKAIDNLKEVKVPITLVMTVENEVNDEEIGKVIEFALNAENIRGINFQPIAYFGRENNSKPENRITLTGVLNRIEKQTSGMLKVADFIPLPCNVERVAVTMLYRNKGEFTPITRQADVKNYLELINNTLAFYAEDIYKNAAHEIVCGSGCDCMKFVKDAIPFLNLSARAAFSKDKTQFATDNFFRITVTSFLDKYNFEMKAMKKECVHILTPDCRRVPFSAYNLFHRKKIDELTHSKT